MPDRVGNGAGRARDADFSDALDAERVHMRIVLVDHDGFEVRHVGVNGDMVLREVGIECPAGAPVHDGMLMQRK